MDPDKVTHGIIGAAMKVHTALGPGLLESAYEACLAHELQLRGFTVERQIEVPVFYEGLRVGVAYRMDMLIEDEVVVELKAVDRLGAVHTMQLLSHLRLTKRRVGLLINFNSARLKDGIRRVVNGYTECTELTG